MATCGYVHWVHGLRLQQLMEISLEDSLGKEIIKQIQHVRCIQIPKKSALHCYFVKIQKNHDHDEERL